VADYLLASDVFVLPSVDLPSQREGTPTALMEAMAARLPVVVSDSGGSKGLVAEAGGGVVVPQRDEARLADAMERLLRDPELRARLGSANRDFIRGRDWSAICPKVIEVYESLRRPIAAA
jgi:glycosyltransferase involved in cell wall biosynthesis